MFDILDVPQRSDAWFTARLGRLTGSRADDMLATIKTGEAAKRRDLRMQLVVERLTGQGQDDPYVNKEMQRGIDREDDAIAAYAAATGRLVTRVGFLACRAYQAGCSPDGIVGNFEGLVEVKCPKSATHLRYLRGGIVPLDYRAQLQHNLWVSGCDWADFVSYDDRFPTRLQVFIARLVRDPTVTAAYERTAQIFLAEVERELQVVATMSSPADQLRASLASVVS